MSPTVAGIYVRISQDRHGEGLGVARQEEDCRARAASLGWQVGHVYIDNDVSAYSGKRRPEYQKLLSDLESGSITAVLAWHPDRLHRSPMELEHYIDLVERREIKTKTVQAGTWDLSTPSGRVTARILGNFARYESEHKGDRIRRARKQQALTGGWHGGIRPYGFEKDGVTVRQSEATEIVNAVEQVIAGVSLRSLVRSLNERGIPTATGKAKWSSVALKDTIMRPRTAGLSSYHGEVVGKAVWPALVPEERWKAACAILSDPGRRTNGGAGGTVRWLGSGIYICGVCGERDLRVGTTGSTQRSTYRCGNRNISTGGGHVTREATKLDDYIERTLVARLSLPDTADLFIQADGDASVDRGELELERATINARLEDVALAYARGSVDLVQLEAVTELLRTELGEIDAELVRSVGTGPLAELASVTDISTAWFGTTENRSDGFSLGKRRAILSEVMDVTILPASRGPVFRPEFVQIDWLQ